MPIFARRIAPPAATATVSTTVGAHLHLQQTVLRAAAAGNPPRMEHAAAAAAAVKSVVVWVGRLSAVAGNICCY